MSIKLELEIDEIRENLSPYTLDAYNSTREDDYSPNILDLGCGSGVPTIHLSELTSGEVFAIDNDPDKIAVLNWKIKNEEINNIITKIASIDHLDFINMSYDLIWSEGSIQFIGFSKGLQYWKKFLKSNGFMVIHYDLSEYEKCIDSINKNNLKLIDEFKLNTDIWWNRFYKPLEEIMERLIKKYDSPKDKKELESYQNQIELIKKNPERFQSVFFILQNMD